MKTINFSVIEILPSLLNKTKTSTIRPAWREIKSHTFTPDKRLRPHLDKNRIIEKPPRFKVGEQVKLFWKQRSKYKLFCRICGEGINAKIKKLWGIKILEHNKLHNCSIVDKKKDFIVFLVIDSIN